MQSRRSGATGFGLLMLLGALAIGVATCVRAGEEFGLFGYLLGLPVGFIGTILMVFLIASGAVLIEGLWRDGLLDDGQPAWSLWSGPSRVGMKIDAAAAFFVVQVANTDRCLANVFAEDNP